MFINLKINIKVLIIILILVFCALAIYSAYTIFDLPNDNDETIIMTTDNFANILKEVHQFPDNYYGHTIKADGYIYIIEDFKENEFVLARNMVICCPSDPAIIGFMCTYPNIKDFEPNSWVNITGTLEHSNEYNRPIINIRNIKESKAPLKSSVSTPTI